RADAGGLGEADRGLGGHRQPELVQRRRLELLRGAVDHRGLGGGQAEAGEGRLFGERDRAGQGGGRGVGGGQPHGGGAGPGGRHRGVGGGVGAVGAEGHGRRRGAHG